MTVNSEFVQIFERLKKDLQQFAQNLVVKEDKPDNYVLISLQRDEKKKEIHFCAVQIKKNYVSFHLVPLYYFPELIDSTTPDLKKRMQGKTCFNFVRSDKHLFDKLKELTEQSFKLYAEKKLI